MLLRIILFLLWVNTVFAHVDPGTDMCLLAPNGCADGPPEYLGTAFADRVRVNEYFLVQGAILSVDRAIDTTYEGEMHISMVSGPEGGQLIGDSIVTIDRWCNFDSMRLTANGYYTLRVEVDSFWDEFVVLADSNLVEEAEGDTDLCKIFSLGGCNRAIGEYMNHLLMDDSIYAGEYFELYAFAKNIIDKIDTGYIGTAVFQVIDGPGNVYGDLTEGINKWGHFDSLYFDVAGWYTVALLDTMLVNDTFEVEVFEDYAVGVDFKIEDWSIIGQYDLYGRLIDPRVYRGIIIEVRESTLGRRVARKIINFVP